MTETVVTVVDEPETQDASTTETEDVIVDWVNLDTALENQTANDKMDIVVKTAAEADTVVNLPATKTEHVVKATVADDLQQASIIEDQETKMAEDFVVVDAVGTTETTALSNNMDEKKAYVSVDALVE